METDMLAILLNLTVGALFGLMTYQVNKAISFVKGGLSKISENRITTLVGGQPEGNYRYAIVPERGPVGEDGSDHVLIFPVPMDGDYEAPGGVKKCLKGDRIVVRFKSSKEFSNLIPKLKK